jgi:uracil-DNA glycosylase
MEQQGQLAASRMIESLTGWWDLAGVDAAVGEIPVDWLAVEQKADLQAEIPAVSHPTASFAPLTPGKPVVEWPSNIDALKTMVLDGAAFPGNCFGTSFVAPWGPSHSEVIVVSDLPDQDEVAGKMLGSGATGGLLSRMLAAIGLDLADCYWTSLANTIPSAGDLPEGMLRELADFVRHQIDLVKPKSVILLGSSACKALLGEELMKARSALRNINHEGSNLATLATFHPRTLIARPAMKAQAWRDLQMFAKRAGL